MSGRGGRGRTDRDGLQPLQQDVSELRTMISNMERIGRVEEVDHKRRMARVRIGDKDQPNKSLLSDWLRIGGDRAGTTTTSRQLSIGEQVAIRAPNGKLENAYIGHSIHNGENEGPSDRGDLGTTTYPDGTTFGLDDGSGAFFIKVPTGSLTLSVGGSSITVTDSTIKLTTGGATIDLSDVIKLVASQILENP